MIKYKLLRLARWYAITKNDRFSSFHPNEVDPFEFNDSEWKNIESNVNDQCKNQYVKQRLEDIDISDY